MEQASVQNTLSLSYLLADLVGLLFFHLVLNWVRRIQKSCYYYYYHFYYSRCLPLLQSPAISRIQHHEEGKSGNSESRTSDDLRLSSEDVEMVMARMGIFICGEGGGRLKEVLGADDLRSVFEEKEPSLEEVKEAFCVFDVNGDGFIDAEELHGVLSKLGFMEAAGSTSPEECRRMIGAYDENGDGMIDFSEFVNFMECSFC